MPGSPLLVEVFASCRSAVGRFSTRYPLIEWSFAPTTRPARAHIRNLAHALSRRSAPCFGGLAEVQARVAPRADFSGFQALSGTFRRVGATERRQSSEEAKIRFQALADADKNNDGEITLVELGMVDLTSLPVDQYGTGGASAVKNLHDFVNALSRTLGHYRGEGECEPHAR